MKYLLILFSILSPVFSTKAQDRNAQTAMFHGCERRCGIYPSHNYTGFGNLQWKFKTGGKVFSSPAVVGDIAYIGSEDKSLYAVDIRTGKQLWKFKTGGAVHSSPAVFNKIVYFGSYDGNYYAVDALTGAEKWRFKTGGEKRIGAKGLWQMRPSDQYMEDLYDFFLSSPLVTGEDKELTVYFGSSDGNLYALDANTGGLKWKFKTNGIIHTSPSLHNGKVYVGSWDNYLYAVDAKTGKEIWKYKTGDQPDVHVLEGIQASPAIHDGTVYFGARDANFYALDSETGSLKWKYFANNSWILTTAAVKDEVVYLGTSDSFLFLALDAKTGKENFNIKSDGYIYSSPAISGTTAFCGDFSGRMFAVDLKSQKITSQFITEGRKRNFGKVYDKNGNPIAAAGKDFSLYQSNVDVMNEIYKTGPIVSSPAISNGVIFFGSADGYLYAVKLKQDQDENFSSSHIH